MKTEMLKLFTAVEMLFGCESSSKLDHISHLSGAVTFLKRGQTPFDLPLWLRLCWVLKVNKQSEKQRRFAALTRAKTENYSNLGVFGFGL